MYIHERSPFLSQVTLLRIALLHSDFVPVVQVVPVEIVNLLSGISVGFFIGLLVGLVSALIFVALQLLG
jgi:thiamine transporter ThiT